MDWYFNIYAIYAIIDAPSLRTRVTYRGEDIDTRNKGSKSAMGD